MKYILQILGFFCGLTFGLAIALMLDLFDYQNFFFEFILIAFGLAFLFTFVYGFWKSREKNKVSDIKIIVFWIIHNFKFLFVPGSNLEDLNKRKRQHELLYPKVNRRYRFKSAFFIIGISIITILFTVAVFQSWLSPYTYVELTTYEVELYVYLGSYHPPSSEHLLGQTFYGFDVLGRIIFGARPVLLFTLTATLISVLIGIFIGALSGYFGGWLDTIVMRTMDIILSFPGVVFAIIFITIWGSDFVILIIIYSIIGIPFSARLMRINVIREKVSPYINAGKVVGAKKFRILFRHILPNSLQSVIVGASYNISRNILSLAILGFLRFGGMGWIEWGNDLSIVLSLPSRLRYAPWAFVYPCLMILIAAIGFLLLGDSLTDAGLLKREKL